MLTRVNPAVQTVSRYTTDEKMELINVGIWSCDHFCALVRTCAQLKAVKSMQAHGAWCWRSQLVNWLEIENAVMNFLYIPYVNHTSVLNSYITNILLFLSIIPPEQTFEVRVQLILGFSKEVSAHIFHGSLPLQLLFWTNSSLSPKLMWCWFGSVHLQPSSLWGDGWKCTCWIDTLYSMLCGLNLLTIPL